MFSGFGCFEMPRWMRLEYMAGMIGSNPRLSPKKVIARASAILDEIDRAKDDERRRTRDARTYFEQAERGDKELNRLLAEMAKQKELRDRACTRMNEAAQKKDQGGRDKFREVVEEKNREITRLDDMVRKAKTALAERVAKKFGVSEQDIR